MPELLARHLSRTAAESGQEGYLPDYRDQRYPREIHALRRVAR